MKRVLVECDGATAPLAVRAQEWTTLQRISHWGAEANLTLTLPDPQYALLGKASSRALDLLRIAAYAFGADQQIRRGGPADIHGDDWRRHIHLVLPVDEPGFWSDHAVATQLEQTIGFVTEDTWSFTFAKAQPSLHPPAFLDLDPKDAFGSPDCVMLFSGGVDSTAAVLEQALTKKRRPLLVSHSPAFHLTHLQTKIRDRLRLLPKRRHEFPLLLPAVHRTDHTDAKETTQRSRSFLFATLGALYANALSVPDVFLADNGIFSVNVPINKQLYGAKASRSTHPRFIRQFNDLLALMFDGPPILSNPHALRTRAEVMRIMLDTNQAALLEETNSCSHTRGLTGMQQHCGTCSQCIDRRFSSIAAGLAEHDPAERYKVDIFRHDLDEGPSRTMAASFVRAAQELQSLTPDQIFLNNPELFDCLPTDAAQQATAALALADLLSRQSDSVLAVMKNQIELAAGELAGGRLPPTSLVALVSGQDDGAKAISRTGTEIFQPHADYRSGKYRGQPFRATPNQARVLGFMHEQKLAGADALSQHLILDRLDIGSPSLLQVFRGSDLWNTLVVKAPGQGMFRLDS